MIPRKLGFWTLVLGLLLPISGYGSGPEHSDANEEGHAATVHVVLVNWYGGELGGKVEIEGFTAQSGGTDYAKLFQNGVATSIPYGIYTARVRAPGFWARETSVRVFQSTVWAVFSLEIGMGKDEGGLQQFRVSGRLSNSKSDDRAIWVHLFGIYSGVTVSTIADSSGDFVLAGLPQGSYVAVTTRGGTTLDVRTLDVPMPEGAVFRIDLAGK